MVGRGSGPALVGRASERATLADAVEEAIDGRGTFVLVDGDAGIGKSRLLAESTGEARRRGVTVVSGSCFPFTEAVPYSAFLEPLAQLGVDPAGEARPGDDGVDRARYFQWVASTFETSACSAPLLLTVEDLHWADTGSGDLLLFLAHELSGRGCSIVATRRTDEAARSTGLAEALVELVRSGAERIQLQPLSPRETADLAAAILGSPPPRSLLEQLDRRAEGNPFFVEELLAAGSDPTLPSSVRELVLTRVARVPGDARALLRVVAVAGRRIDHRLLAALTDGDGLDELLRATVDAHVLVVDDEGYAFRHALIQEAVYGELLPGERQVLHRRVAEALDANPELSVSGRSSAAAELAHHWHAAGRHREALVQAVVAAGIATGHHAPAAALHQYRVALDLWDRVPDAAAVTGMDRAAVCHLAATAASDAGCAEEAVVLTRQALSETTVDDRDAYADTLCHLSAYLWMSGDIEECRAVDLTLAEHLPRGPTSARARALSTLGSAAMVDGRFLDAVPLLTEAIEIAEHVGAVEVQRGALRALGESTGALGCHDDAERLLRSALDVDGNGHEVAWGWGFLAVRHSHAMRFADAVDAAERGLDEVRRRGMWRTHEPALVAILAEALIGAGRWDEADLVTAAALADDPAPTWAAQLRYSRSSLLMRRGRVEEAEGLLDLVADRIGPNDAPDRLAAVAGRRAELALLCERPDEALSEVKFGLDALARTDDVGAVLRLTALATRAIADATTGIAVTGRAGAVAASRRAADERLEHADDFLDRVERAVGCRSDVFRLCIDLARAERSRLDDRPEPALWASVADRAGEDVYLHAYASYRNAEALLTLPTGRGQAHPVLQQAYTLAEPLDAKPLLGIVQELAGRARVELSSPSIVAVPATTRAASPGDLGLTARELEVLRLVEKGLSNGEIASALFISPKTASVHVSHILQKLGVRTRVQAAALAHRSGLTSP